MQTNLCLIELNHNFEPIESHASYTFIQNDKQNMQSLSDIPVCSHFITIVVSRVDLRQVK